jgi:sugar phosphate isomerase/epimerase
MTQLGLGSYAYAWAIGVPGYPVDTPMDAFAFLRRADALGFRLVQYDDNLPLHALAAADFTALLSEADRLNIAIEVGTRGIDPDHLRRYLGIAQRCGSPILRVVVDSADHHPEPDEVTGALRGLLPELSAAGVTIAIENHDRYKAHTLAGLISALDSPHVGVCLDTVNSFGALEGPDVVIAALGPHVVNLHIKDFEIKRLDHSMGFALTGAPAGSGMLNVPDVLAQLHAMGRQFNAILEQWPAWEGDIAATTAKEDRWAQQSARYLQGLLKE